MIHNIGMPVVLQTIVAIDKKFKWNCDEETASYLMNRYHMAFTKYMLMSWNLPTLIKESVSNYDRYNESIDYKIDAAVINLSNKLSIWSYDEKTMSKEKLSEDFVLDTLKIRLKDLNLLFDKKNEILELASNMKF